MVADPSPSCSLRPTALTAISGAVRSLPTAALALPPSLHLPYTRLDLLLAATRLEYNNRTVLILLQAPRMMESGCDQRYQHMNGEQAGLVALALHHLEILMRQAYHMHRLYKNNRQMLAAKMELQAKASVPDLRFEKDQMAREG